MLSQDDWIGSCDRIYDELCLGQINYEEAVRRLERLGLSVSEAYRYLGEE